VQATEVEPGSWRWLAYAYVAVVLAVFGYFLADLPVQVSDSYGNLVQAARGSLGSLVRDQFLTHAFLRPLLWANIRIVYDLSGGSYYEWFRGFHVAQWLILGALFVHLLRPRTRADAVAVPIGLAALIGIHTFAGTVRESFPINAYLTILICCFAAAALALGPYRRWRDVAAALLFVFAALSVESGLLVAVVLVAAHAAGARGVSRAGIAAIVLLVAGYLVLRFGVLGVGTPDLLERSSGFGFSTLEPDELAARFQGRELLFYAYNVGSSLLSVLFSEPRAGVWHLTRRIAAGEWPVAALVNVIASVIGTAIIGIYMFSRRHDWYRRHFTRDDQLVVVFVAVALANSVISYAYTKDVILSPAGAFYAIALALGVRSLLISASAAPVAMRAVAAIVLAIVSSAWAFRAVGIHVGLRASSATLRDDWVLVDDSLRHDDPLVREPAAIELKRHLQQDAIWRHPGRPEMQGDWVSWFDED
jgi:hypothetical protein